MPAVIVSLNTHNTDCKWHEGRQCQTMSADTDTIKDTQQFQVNMTSTNYNSDKYFRGRRSQISEIHIAFRIHGIGERWIATPYVLHR